MASVILSGRDIPSNHVVMHKCDNKICVNPDHLVVTRQLDNVMDFRSKYVSINIPTKLFERFGSKEHIIGALTLHLGSEGWETFKAPRKVLIAAIEQAIKQCEET